MEFCHSMRKKRNTKRFKVVCHTCNKVFYVTECDLNRNKKYCSKKCKGISKRIQHSFINSVEHKRCSRCGDYFSLDCFSKSTRDWDGLSGVCKICFNKVSKEREYSKKNYNYIIVELVKQECQQCGTSFLPSKSNKQKFCSKKCSHSNYMSKYSESVKEKKKKHYNDVTRLIKNIAIHGSEEHINKISGENRYNWVESIIKDCPNCGKNFSFKPSENKTFCSIECYHEFSTGDNHWNWIEDRSSIISRRGNEFSSQQKRFIKNRDKMICQFCGVITLEDGNKSDDSCHVDHIIPITREGSNDTMNGRVLCKKCNMYKKAKLDEEIFLKIYEN